MSVLVRVGSQAYKYYNDLLERSPVSTKSVTSGVMYAGGDAIAQYVEHYKANENKTKEEQTTFTFDKKRLAVFFIYGTCVAGPVYHYWFNYLNELPQVLWRLKQSRQRGKILRAYAYLRSHNIEVKLDLSKLPVAPPLAKWKNKAYKIAADQLIFSSLYTLAFFMGIGVLSGGLDRLEIRLKEFAIDSESTKTRVQYEEAHRSGASNPTSSQPDSAPTTSNDYEILIHRLKVFMQDQEDVFYGRKGHSTPSAEEEDTPPIEDTPHPTLPELPQQVMTAEQLKLLEDVLSRLRREQELSEEKLSWRNIWMSTWQHTKDVYVQTYITDCLVWPPLQLINFTFVPVRFQFLFVNVANLAWNTFLSLMANSSHAPGGNSNTTHSAENPKPPLST